MTTKPDLTRTWASGAPGGNIEDPDVTVPGKFAAGWTAEIPPFENFNFLQQLFTQGLAHNNEQGINSWDTDTVYPVGALVKGSDGIVYKALISQNGNDPITPSANWTLADATELTKQFGIGASGSVVPILADFNVITNPSGFYKCFGAGTGTPTPNGPPTSGNNQMSAYVTNINGITHYIVKENDATAVSQRLHIGNTHSGAVNWVEVPTEYVFTNQQSKVTNGYQQLPGGLILQWGLATAIPNNGEKTITFPIAFPNVALNVVATLQQPNFVTGGWIIFIDTIAAANFVIGCDDVSSTAGTPNAYWYAIGH